MSSANIIAEAIDFVKDRLSGAEAGHDWHHTERVWKLSKKIAEREGGDLLIIELAALLHDIADAKFHNGDENLALRLASEFMEANPVGAHIQSEVLAVIKNISFKNSAEAAGEKSLELRIVQDADRLDAIGAIGIARTFNFGGFKNNRMYDPHIPARSIFDSDTYKKYNGTTINHFYEKLLLLKDQMNTETAKEMAMERHRFMEEFLARFLAEWHLEGY